MCIYTNIHRGHKGHRHQLDELYVTTSYSASVMILTVHGRKCSRGSIPPGGLQWPPVTSSDTDLVAAAPRRS